MVKVSFVLILVELIQDHDLPTINQVTSNFQSVTAASLVSASRLDVFSKTDFVKAYLNGYPTSWGRTIYREYLKATRPSAKFDENQSKFSIDDYEREFVELIESCKSRGFDSTISRVPVGTEGIINGSHRLAVGVCLGLTLAIEKVDEQDHIYDYRFMNRIGLPDLYRQHMSWNLISHRSDARAFLLTNLSTETERVILHAIQEFAQVVTVENVSLTKIGERRLMELAYGHNEWWRQQYRETMVAERFSGSSSRCAVVFTIGSDLSRAAEQKSSLRKILQREHFERQVHGTDDFSDTVTLAEVFLNRNSLHYLNSAPIDAETRIMGLLGRHQSIKTTSDLNVDWCIDGSAVMEMHGIRRARDIDYVVTNTEQLPSQLVLKGDNHELEFLGYPISIYDLIYDPRLHFRFHGYKFMSLPTLSFIKCALLDHKAISDVLLIAKFYEMGGPVYSDAETRKRAQIWRLQLVLNSLIVSFIKLLPEQWQKKIRSVLVQCKKLITRWN